MEYRCRKIFGIGMILSMAIALLASALFAGEVPEAPVKGTVTMIDLGADKCIPCKMMAPILRDLEKEYKGKAAVVFIDLRHHKEMARKYKVRAIPTQILYDKNGKEVGRHQGFLSKKAIEAAFKELGVEK